MASAHLYYITVLKVKCLGWICLFSSLGFTRLPRWCCPAGLLPGGTGENLLLSSFRLAECSFLLHIWGLCFQAGCPQGLPLAFRGFFLVPYMYSVFLNKHGEFSWCSESVTSFSATALLLPARNSSAFNACDQLEATQIIQNNLPNLRSVIWNISVKFIFSGNLICSEFLRFNMWIS